VVSKRRNNSIIGIFVLLAVFTLLFSVVGVRFFYLQSKQTADGRNLLVESQKRHSRTKTLLAQRGAILDRNGVVIADDTVSYLLQAVVSKDASRDTPKNPVHVVDKELTAKELSKYIEMPEEKILNILEAENVYQVEFGAAGRNISSRVKEEIEKLKLPGLIFVPQSKRFYKSGFFASHVIGYVQKDSDNNNKVTGMLGLEKEFDKYLTGINGEMDYLADSKNRIYPGVKPKITPPKAGATVETTIDRKIQTFLEDAMSKVQTEFTPVKMIGIVANPKTGEILAMSQRPTFNLNTKEGLEENWKNLAIEESFEPGSTFKIFTLAAAVNEGMFNPNADYPSGQYTVPGGTIKDHNGGKGWGRITYLEGLQRSSNVAFSKIAMEQLGPDKFMEYITRFGFDNKTGINLLNEATSKIQYKYPIEKTTTSFGQGTAVTPIQQIQAATAIANQGKMMQPYVVSKISDPTTKKVLYEHKPTVAGEPITPDTAKQVLNYLETVVTSEAGTGKPYRIEGYQIAGKTGTAQIPDPETHKYLFGDKNYIFSFMGFAPKDDPEIVVYVAVQQPNIQIGQLGSLPVSKIFNPVVENTLKYLNIKPENIAKAQSVSMPDFVGKTSADVTAFFAGKSFSPIFIGNGSTIVSQSIQPKQTIIQGEKVLFATDGAPKIPNLTGWSLRDANRLSSLMGMKLTSKGNGYVAIQDPPEGTIMNKGDLLKIELKTPTEFLLSAKEEKETEKDTVKDKGKDTESKKNEKKE
jgi:penicillin-binding protein 2B